jgi:hypothetical protein
VTAKRKRVSPGEALISFFDAPADQRMVMIWKAIHDHAHGDKGASALLTMIGRTMRLVPARSPRGRR